MKTKNIVICLFLIISIQNLYSLPLKETLKNTLSTNPEIKALRSNTDAYKYYIDEAFSSYLPKISIDYYLENKNSMNENLIRKTNTEKKQNGYNAIIKYEQMIFDGWDTPSKVKEAKHNYNENKIKNIAQVENLLFDTIEAYLDSVKFKEFSLLSKNNIEIHERYFEIAVESEKVSGEKLDRLQVESKLVDSKAKFIKEKRDADSKYETLLKLSGLSNSSLICRPLINIKDLKSKKILLAKALSSNYAILAELERIKAQRDLINQKRANFLPTIKAKIQKEYDDDLDAQGFYKEETSARITLSYNLFNGLKDRSSYLKEKKFLFEAQKTLDNKVRSVSKELNSEKTILDSSVERIKYLKKYVVLLKDILLITQEQFEGGTKTFLEVLSSQATLNKAKKDLIEEEYVNLMAYYKLLNITSNLSETVFSSASQICKTISADLSIINDKQSEEDEINNLLNEEPLEKNKKENTKKENKKEIDNMLSDLLDEVYESDDYTKKIKPKVKDNLINKKDNSNKINASFKISKRYTITLLQSSDVKKSLTRLKKQYSLDDDILKHTFSSKNKRLTKIAYGSYDTYLEAFTDIKNLPKSLQKNKPYVSLINND